MREIIIAKGGEYVLKGLNRGTFQNALMSNLKRRLKSLGRFDFSYAQSTIYIVPLDDDIDIDGAVRVVSDIFGISALSRAAECKKDMDIIKETALSYAKDKVMACTTFKVEARRSDKEFPLTSPQIEQDVGAFLLENIPGAKVNVLKPDINVYIEIREHSAYVHAGKIAGAGGIPLGCSGRGTLLLSGGIDSPVAGYMMAKRGLMLDCVYFHSFPYTSDRAKQKVIDLARILTGYTGRTKVDVVNFTEIQTEIRKLCHEDYFTLIMRRFMMKIASTIAVNSHSQALITGESLGQVASQTIEALNVTNNASSLAVFRPLIGMDKEEIVTIARRIGTFDTSILPFEDCCTVFAPKHPMTHPTLFKVLEAALPIKNEEELIERAVAQVETILLP